MGKMTGLWGMAKKDIKRGKKMMPQEREMAVMKEMMKKKGKKK